MVQFVDLVPVDDVEKGIHSFEDLPEESVVGMATAVVSHRGKDVFRNLLKILYQRFDGFRLQVGLIGNGGIEFIEHVKIVVTIDQ